MVKFMIDKFMIEQLYDLENLLKSFNAVRHTSGWKAQTQNYEENCIIRLTKLKQSLEKRTYEPSKPNTFIYNERGKTRLIESYSIEDRIVQGCLVNSILIPKIKPYLIYDNAASLEHRGTDFFRKRLEIHLKNFYKENGCEGYILLIDYRKFFDNIWHETFYNALDNFKIDKETIDFVKFLVSKHRVDVSYMSSDEYKNCMQIPFDALWYYNNITDEQKTREKFMPKSFGIGSAIAQVAGISSPYMIGNFVKIVQGCKYYGRYMDDSYIIHKDKDYLHYIKTEIEKICNKYGFILNQRKTQIVNLRHKFTILKTQYKLCTNGGIIKIPDASAYKRERRKIKAMKRKSVKEADARKQFVSWRNAIIKRCGEYKSIRSINDYYERQFKTKL